MELFIRPFGQFLSKALRPLASSLMDMATRFNDIASEDGLAVAVGTIAAEAVTSLATGIANAIGNIISGEGTLADFLFAGAGAVGLAKLVKKTPIGGVLKKSAIGGLLTRSSVGGLLSKVGAGSIIGSVGLGTLVSTVGTLTLAVGTIKAAEFTADTVTQAFGPGKPENFDPIRELRTFLSRNVTNAPAGLSPQEARERAFERALDRAEDRENINRLDVIEAFRAEFDRAPPSFEDFETDETTQQETAEERRRRRQREQRRSGPGSVNVDRLIQQLEVSRIREEIKRSNESLEDKLDQLVSGEDFNENWDPF
jgi:hypothetical protein